MTSKSESVSVVIPSYNYGRFVCDAVDSALSQTYPRVNVIVVDDGSADDTAARLKPYGKRIRYIRQENKGLSAARNTAIKHSDDTWIALLDADDRWHKQKLEVQLRALVDRQGIGLLGSPSAAAMPDTLPLDAPKFDLTVRDFVLSARFGPSGALIRRSCFDSIGLFNEELRSVEDRDMWLRVAARFQVLLVDSPCWWYRHHPDQMSRNADRMFENYRRVIDDFFRSHPEHYHLRRIAESYLYFDASWTYFEQGEKLTALNKLLGSVLRCPFGLGDARVSGRFVRLKRAYRILFGGSPARGAAYESKVGSRKIA